MIPFDPELVPLDPLFGPTERGGAVLPARLSAAGLRTQFASPPIWTPELFGDDRRIDPARPERAASVLIPLVARDSGVSVLLTRRAEHLHDHAGQISFPGGRRDAGDRDAEATALRETQEEIGLAPAGIELLGRLPDYLTASSYRVTPVVAMLAPPLELKLDDFEVAEAFEVPLAFLMDPAHHERRSFEFAGAQRHFYAMPWQAERRYFIWGATAAMLRNLYRFLAA